MKKEKVLFSFMAVQEVWHKARNMYHSVGIKLIRQWSAILTYHSTWVVNLADLAQVQKYGEPRDE